MNKQEYIEEMKKRGWSVEIIDEELKAMEEAQNDGLKVDYEMFLLEVPILD